MASLEKKQGFGAVTLLNASTGLLDITVIPVANQPDWVIPSNIVLDVQPMQEKIWTYLWQQPSTNKKQIKDTRHQQEVAVYHLYNKTELPEKVVVIEGMTDVHRIALQIQGELKQQQVKISDVKDADEKLPVPYNFQTVLLNGKLCVVPDLDRLSHYLVDLDG